MNHRHIRILLAAVVVAAAITGVAFADEAQKPAPPQFPASGELKNTRTVFCEIYAEGVKVGFSKWTIGEGQLDNKRVFLIEEQADMSVGEGDNARSLSVHTRALADGNSMQLICAEETEKHDGWERYGFVSLENGDKGPLLKFYKKIGEKISRREDPVPGGYIVYPDILTFTAFTMQTLPVLRNGDQRELHEVSPLGGLDSVYMTYHGKTTAAIDGKEALAYSLETRNSKKLIVDQRGNTVVRVSQDGLSTTLRADEQKYNKMPGKLDGYQCPPYIDKNTATLPELGISIDRPDRSCFFGVSADVPIITIYDGFSEGNVGVWVFTFVPEKATPADIVERFAKAVKDLAPNEEINFSVPRDLQMEGAKAILGDITVTQLGETRQGLYRAIIKDGRGVVVFMDAPEPIWKKSEWRLGKIASSLKFIDLPKNVKEPELVKKDPVLGLELTLPGKQWQFVPGQNSALSARMMWDMLFLTVIVAPRAPDITLEKALESVKKSASAPGNELKDIKTIKIGGFDAIIVEALVRKLDNKGSVVKTRAVCILRADTVLTLVFAGIPSFWEDAVPDIDKIIETLKVSEPVVPKEAPKEEKPPESPPSGEPPAKSGKEAGEPPAPRPGAGTGYIYGAKPAVRRARS